METLVSRVKGMMLEPRVTWKEIDGEFTKGGDIWGNGYTGTQYRGVIVRTKKATRRDDGSYVRFDRNAMVLIDAENNPRGTRVFGAVGRELRDKKFVRIVNLAAEVV